MLQKRRWWRREWDALNAAYLHALEAFPEEEDRLRIMPDWELMAMNHLERAPRGCRRPTDLLYSLVECYDVTSVDGHERDWWENI